VAAVEFIAGAKSQSVRPWTKNPVTDRRLGGLGVYGSCRRKRAAFAGVDLIDAFSAALPADPGGRAGRCEHGGVRVEVGDLELA
jgi:hypothetical protein